MHFLSVILTGCFPDRHFNKACSAAVLTPMASETILSFIDEQPSKNSIAIKIKASFFMFVFLIRLKIILKLLIILSGIDNFS